MRFYTGVGSRKTPEPILKQMISYGIMLGKLGYVLRSGAAPGADTAFEQGCDMTQPGRKEIYLPWKGFQDHPSTLYTISPETMEMAGEIYGEAWRYLKRPIRLLMARDIQQVVGPTLDELSRFVICWTPDGCRNRRDRTRKTGGTGQAIACASYHGIPIFNLQREGEKERLNEFLTGELE